tara:strand:- start:2 stop:1192 length:1191 start_codon:yes stop_codon:yes gene_type:complete
MNTASSAISFAWLVLIGAVLAAVFLASRAFGSTDGVIPLFGRWDVVACCLIATLPLSLFAVDLLRNTRGIVKLCIACGLLALAIIMVSVAQSINLAGGLGMGSLTLVRGTVATISMIILLLVCRVLGAEIQLPAYLTSSWRPKAMLIAIAFLIPAAYADAVADGIRIDLENSLDSRRFATAERQARTMAEIVPGGIVHDKALLSLIPELQRTVEQMEEEVRRPLRTQPPIAEVGRRITLLMHLDRLDDALQLLSPLRRDPRFRPTCLDYQGLCWQRQEHFSKSLAAYQSAVAYWQTQPDSDRKQLSLASAWKGVGFAARRLGKRTLEEHAYQTLVDLSPTAESHLLLAQCYSEHQKTKLAGQHAALAVELDPNLQAQSASMLTSMSRDHFGCLQLP